MQGWTKGARSEVFALQPAPVQCSYMGFPSTTGAPWMQWIVVDKVRLLHGLACAAVACALSPEWGAQ